MQTLRDNLMITGFTWDRAFQVVSNELAMLVFGKGIG